MRPSSRNAARYDASLSVVIVSGWIPWRLISFLSNFSAACFADKQIIVADKHIKTNVLDRVGSGDAFVSGFIYGLLDSKELKFAINCGAAHGVLVMTTIGDNSTATVEEIEHLMRGDSSAAKR